MKMFVILEGTTDNLANEVNEYLKSGWKLHGQPFRTGNSICCDENDPIWVSQIAQAMTLEDK